MTGIKGLRRGANIYLPAGVDVGALAYKAATTREAWLTPGTTDQVVGSTGVTPAIPSYRTPAAGGGGGGSVMGLVPLARLVASNSAQLDFTTFISSTYDKYLIVGESLVLQTVGADLLMRVMTGGTPAADSGAVYDYDIWRYASSSATGNSSAGNATAIKLFPTVRLSSGDACNFSITATALQSTVLRKYFFGNGYYIDNTGPLAVGMSIGATYNTAATPATGLRFVPSSGNIVSGSITIYGIANTLIGTTGLAASSGLDLLGVYSGTNVAALSCLTRANGGNLFQSDYDLYRFYVMQVRPVTDGVSIRHRAIVGGTPDSGNNYTYVTLASVAGGIGGAGADSTLVSYIGYATLSNVAGMSASYWLDVTNPRGSLHKQFATSLSRQRPTAADARRVGFWIHGYYESSNQVDGIELSMSSGNIDNIVVYAYGVNKTPGATVGVGTAGKIAQIIKTETAAFASGTTVIPHDDTIPQNTEGDQYFSLSITPTNAASTLLIECNALWGAAGSSAVVTVALFQDSGVNAIAASNDLIANSGAAQHSLFRHFMTAGNTNPTTFKIRAGINATTCYLNGPGARRFGGVAASSFSITEILP